MTQSGETRQFEIRRMAAQVQRPKSVLGRDSARVFPHIQHGSVGPGQPHFNPVYDKPRDAIFLIALRVNEGRRDLNHMQRCRATPRNRAPFRNKEPRSASECVCQFVVGRSRQQACDRGGIPQRPCRNLDQRVPFALHTDIDAGNDSFDYAGFCHPRHRPRLNAQLCRTEQPRSPAGGGANDFVVPKIAVHKTCIPQTKKGTSFANRVPTSPEPAPGSTSFKVDCSTPVSSTHAPKLTLPLQRVASRKYQFLLYG